LRMVDLQKTLKDLRSEFGSVASAVVSRDGILIAADIPEDALPETFTIMCATMMGAASTAHSELKIGQPRILRVTSDRHEMILIGAGRKAIVCCVVPIGARIEPLQQRLQKIIEGVREAEI